MKTRPPILERGNRSTCECRIGRCQVFYWKKSRSASKSRSTGETNSLRPLQSDVFTQPRWKPDIGRLVRHRLFRAQDGRSGEGVQFSKADPSTNRRIRTISAKSGPTMLPGSALRQTVETGGYRNFLKGVRSRCSLTCGAEVRELLPWNKADDWHRFGQRELPQQMLVKRLDRTTASCMSWIPCLQTRGPVANVTASSRLAADRAHACPANQSPLERRTPWGHVMHGQVAEQLVNAVVQRCAICG